MITADNISADDVERALKYARADRNLVIEKMCEVALDGVNIDVRYFARGEVSTFLNARKPGPIEFVAHYLYLESLPYGQVHAGRWRWRELPDETRSKFIAEAERKIDEWGTAEMEQD